MKISLFATLIMSSIVAPNLANAQTHNGNARAASEKANKECIVSTTDGRRITDVDCLFRIRPKDEVMIFDPAADEEKVQAT
jgi:hypothetical protein